MKSSLNHPHEDSGRPEKDKAKDDSAVESAASGKDALTDAQKREARAPHVPPYSVPPAKPAEPGKPVWPKPHSS